MYLICVVLCCISASQQLACFAAMKQLVSILPDHDFLHITERASPELKRLLSQSFFRLVKRNRLRRLLFFCAQPIQTVPPTPAKTQPATPKEVPTPAKTQPATPKEVCARDDACVCVCVCVFMTNANGGVFSSLCKVLLCLFLYTFCFCSFDLGSHVFFAWHVPKIR